MKSASIFQILFSLILLFGSLQAEIYTWLDKKGVRHYSDIFPGRGEDIVDLQVFDTEEPPPPQVQEKTTSAVIDTTVNTSKSVVMYIEPDCNECAQARAFFKQNNIQLLEMDITSSKGAASAFTRVGGSKVPLIMIGNTKIEGYNQAAIIKALSTDQPVHP